jgi:hypothetical protein
MPDLLERPNSTGSAPAERIVSLPEGDEKPARAELRRQIGRLEGELGRLFAEAFPRKAIDWSVAPAGGPRLLGIAELEEVRDSLVTRIGEARLVLSERLELETRNRELLQQMLADPARFKGLRISSEEIGRPGCGTWQSRPRFGMFGMLMGWWRVKVSSGCPLPKGRRPTAPRPKKNRGTPISTRMSRSKRRKRRPRRAPDYQPPRTPGSRSATAAEPPRTAPAADGTAPERPRSRSAARDERPPAPWGSFPLQELTVLIGLIILIYGVVRADIVVITVGLAIGCLGGLELTVREHFAGYRSHSSLLAGTAFVITVGAVYYSGALVLLYCLLIGAVVFAAAFLWLRSVFRRASGGLNFRVGRLGG